jgi:hypothetical protein
MALYTGNPAAGNHNIKTPWSITTNLMYTF